MTPSPVVAALVHLMRKHFFFRWKNMNRQTYKIHMNEERDYMERDYKIQRGKKKGE